MRGQHETRAQDEPGGKEHEEHRRLGEFSVDGGFESERFADDIAGRERQHRGGEKASVENAEGKDQRSELARDRTQRDREVCCLLRVEMAAVLIDDPDRRGACDLHERGERNREDRAIDYVGARQR